VLSHPFLLSDFFTNDLHFKWQVFYVFVFIDLFYMALFMHESLC